MRRSFVGAALVLVAGITASGCSGGAGESSEPTESSSQAIIDGTNSTSAQDSVVLIEQPLSATEMVICSGVLLAPNLVMTARHCVSNLPDEAFTCDENGVGSEGGDVLSDVDPSSLYIFVGATRKTKLSQAAAKGKELFHDDATNICNHDVAVILLDTSIPDAVVAPVRLDSGPLVNESIIAVGWGVTSTTETPGTRQQRTIGVQRVGPGRDDADELDVPPNEFEVGESICEGDSGGPAFDATTGAVVGVVSRGGNGTAPVDNDPASSCVNASNFYSEPSHFVAVIDAAYTAAGATPDLESGSDAGTGPSSSSGGGSGGGCAVSAPGAGSSGEPSRAGLVLFGLAFAALISRRSARTGETGQSATRPRRR